MANADRLPEAGGSPATLATRRPDPRAIRTREALLRAGYALFAERGLHDAGIDDIIARADVSRQTFYNHFPDKMALARAIYLSIRHTVEAEIQAANHGIADPAARVARGVCVYVRTARDDPDHIRFITRLLVHDVGVEDPADRGLMQDLAAGLAAGRFVIRTIESAAAFVVGASEPLLLSVVADRNRAHALIMAQEFLTMTLRGLSVPAGEADLIAAQAANSVLR